jgi:hypothetical protein
MPAGRRRAHVIALGVGLLALSLTRLALADSHGWVEDFAQGRLDQIRWQRTVAGDLREWWAEVVEAPGRGSGFRLRLRADTRGTRDDTLKFVGVGTVMPIALREGSRVAVRLDWGEQANGSYLTAGLVLSPHATAGNPLDAPDWLQVVYVGVPPGRNARLVVAYRTHGRERTVHTEGWPDTNRQGRRIGVQDLAVRVRDGAFEVWEGERLVWRSQAGEIAPVPAHLYLQMSSHSNYPARSIHFERVEVR